jgi:acyl-CoA reductase-like NAD-dependent aldehyde dehydrogenase
MRKFAQKLRESAEEAASLETKAMGSAVMTQTMGYGVAASLFDYYRYV